MFQIGINCFSGCIDMEKLKNFSKPIPLPYYPRCAGIYLLIGKNKKILYVGCSKQLCRRVSHLTALQKDSSNTNGLSHIKAGYLRNYQEKNGQVAVRFMPCKNFRAKEKELIEKLETEKLKPLWNRTPKRKYRKRVSPKH